jgi:hypothetical protein
MLHPLDPDLVDVQGVDIKKNDVYNAWTPLIL